MSKNGRKNELNFSRILTNGKPISDSTRSLRFIKYNWKGERLKHSINFHYPPPSLLIVRGGLREE